LGEIMRRVPFFLMFCLAVSTRAEIDQRALLGTWFRSQDQKSIEVAFTRDGAFSQSITSAGERRPIARIDGRWTIEGDIVKLTLSSTAPVGVVPRQDRIVTWRIEKVSDAELSVIESGSKQSWQFSKKK
jgi:hypothetical protein